MHHHMLTDEQAAPGAPRRLLQYIRQQGVNIPDFCRSHQIDRQKLEKVIKGRYKRLDVDFALAVERATERAITVPDWETSGAGA